MPNPPNLRVDTGRGNSLIGDSISVASPSSPRSPSFGTFSRERARSISQAVLPSFRISNVSDAGKSNVPSSSPPKASVPHGFDKARNESRKLLAHILSQLQSRPMPPSLLSTLAIAPLNDGRRTTSVIKAVKGAVSYTGTMRERRTHQPVPQDDEDSEDESIEGFTTDITHDLLNQLKDVLVISIAHNWDIFYDSPSHNERSNSDKVRDSFMRRRSISVGRGLRSRSPSVGRNESEGVIRAPQLLSQCISILASIISEDCRFKIASFRPLRPPNSLQSIALDLARFLVHTHRHDPRVISQVAFAVFPAFMTFSSEMHAHLLKFFDDGVLGSVLADLRSVQGTTKIVSPTADTSYSGIESNTEPPMVSILVDEVREDSTAPTSSESTWRRWMRALSSEDIASRSTSAPLQDPAIYHLSSIIPPLLAAIFDNIDLVAADAPTAYRFHLLITRIAESKPDAYLDVLAVLAYHTPRARYAAISVLQTYWPHGLGHLSTSKPFLTTDYHEAVARETKDGSTSRRYRSHPYSHQFVPWRVDTPLMPNLFNGLSQYDCHACGSEIDGLALLCPLCMCLVHFNCYDDPDGSFFTQYGIAAEPSMQKVAVHRFCHILPHRHISSLEVVYKEQHAFRPVNMFSLTLCFICRNPLWGPVAQALKCGTCNQFVHPICLTKADKMDLPACRSVIIDDTYMTISWDALRQSFAEHYRDIFLTQVDLPNKTYEEISVYLGVLWIQLQILLNGLALGSIVVKQDSPAFSEGQLDEFELHYLVELYEAYLSSSTITVSQTLSDHLMDNRLLASPTHLLFNWNVLTYVASVIKMPISTTEDASADLLSAIQPGHQPESLEDSAYPFEVITLAHLRDQLGDQLNLHSESAARYFLSHLFHLGIFQRVDRHVVLFDGGPHPERIQCFFPVPVGLEVSAEVETLVVSIEACLSDINLSVNEIGFLLLVRKFWPDGMLTEYALRRLTKAVLGWILSEDNDLAIMLRDYVARGLPLPGVRSGTDMSWPMSTQPRQAPTSSANNGGDYVACRRALSIRYAARWLLALHDQDMNNYSIMIFDLLIEQAQELPVRDEYFLGKSDETVERREAIITEKILHLVLKLSQASVLFTTFDDLFQKWLNRASSLDVDQQTYIASIPKLFNKELDASSQRFTTMVDPRLTLTETPTMLTLNPLKVIIDIATKSNEGYDSTLHWLCLFVRSGVEISVPTFMQLVQLGNRFGVSLEVCSLLVKAALWSCWLRSMGRQDLQTVIVAIHTGIGPQLESYLKAHHLVSESLQIIRQSLATCLLLYGCGRSYLQSSGLVLESEVKGLPSRRKMNARNDTITDPIIVNSNLIDALKMYVESGLEDVACVAAKFLEAFMHESALVETYEVDNFILRNGQSLCTCMWQFYGVQRSEISQTRMKILLRILVVDAQPFQDLLESLFDPHGSWEIRLEAVVRLFRIVQDVICPSFAVEDRQWRSSVIDVFRYCFGALWEDDREEIRLAVDTWTQTLLAGHFEAIALCWDEALAKSPMPDRMKLVAFLNQLRPHFPHWQLLSWQIILEALLEGEFLQRNGDDEDGPMSAHLSMYGLPSGTRDTTLVDPDVQALQNSLITLSLRMIAEGIPIDTPSLLRLKEHLAKSLGFAEVAAVVAPGNGNGFSIRFGSLDTIPAASYPCINELMLTLDSAQPYGLVSSSMGGRHLDDEAPTPLLVGSVFVDLFLETFIHCDELETLPALTLKNLLRSLIIVIYKHDFDSRPLKPHQGTLRRAVKQALDLLLLDISYDLRQLVLTACHAFIKRWPNLIGNFICDAIESTINLLEKLQYHQNGDDILVDQTRNFLRVVLGLYAFSGAFYLLCKRRRTHEFFVIIRYIAGPQVKAERNPHPLETLRDALLRDTLTRSIEGDEESLQIVVENISTYVDVVHHTDYPLALMQFVGLCLASLTRKTADLHYSRFDPSPLLLLACTLIQHNKAHSRDLLLYLETLLRSSLNRFNVSTASLRRVLQVTTTLYRKAARVAGPNAPDGLVNPLTSAMLEITRETLNVKARVTPSTLAALIEAFTVNPDNANTALPTFIPLESHVILAADGLFYLFTESSSDSVLHSDFAASQAVARMVLQGAEIQRGMLGNVGKNPMSVRIWNVFVLAALSRPSGLAAGLLFEQFSAFSLAYCTSLHAYHNVHLSEPEIQDRAHADVSSAYAAIKLWLLLARKAAAAAGDEPDGAPADALLRDGEGDAAKMVWNELWPPFEMVLSAFEADARAGNTSPLASTVWSSVADLFLFVRQSRSVVGLDTVAPAGVLGRLKDFVRGESKVTRVVRSLKDAPPDDSLDYFVGQVLTEITAEEKLQAAKRQINVERGRRMMG